MDKKDFPSLSNLLEDTLKGRGEVERVYFESTPGSNPDAWPNTFWGPKTVVPCPSPFLDISNLMRMQEMLNGGIRRGDLLVMGAITRPRYESKIDMLGYLARQSPDPAAFMERYMKERAEQGIYDIEGFDQEGFKKSLERLYANLETGEIKPLFVIDSCSDLTDNTIGPFEPGTEVTVNYQAIGGKRRKKKKDKNVNNKKKLKASKLAKGLLNRI